MGYSTPEEILVSEPPRLEAVRVRVELVAGSAAPSTSGCAPKASSSAKADDAEILGSESRTLQWTRLWVERAPETVPVSRV